MSWSRTQILYLYARRLTRKRIWIEIRDSTIRGVWSPETTIGSRKIIIIITYTPQTISFWNGKELREGKSCLQCRVIRNVFDECAGEIKTHEHSWHFNRETCLLFPLSSPEHLRLIVNIDRDQQQRMLVYTTPHKIAIIRQMASNAESEAEDFSAAISRLRSEVTSGGRRN